MLPGRVSNPTDAASRITSCCDFQHPLGELSTKTIVFGAKASQDLFDNMMFRIFRDIPMCMNQRDDILIGGRNMDEPNKTLEAVFQKAKDFGITFNLEKCQFGVEELDFRCGALLFMIIHVIYKYKNK